MGYGVPCTGTLLRTLYLGRERWGERKSDSKVVQEQWTQEGPGKEGRNDWTEGSELKRRPVVICDRPPGNGTGEPRVYGESRTGDRYWGSGNEGLATGSRK